MAKDRDIVQVTKQVAALSSPNFVIEYEGRLYLTLALLEYDAKARNLNAEQKRGVKQMREMFDAARGSGGLTAVLVAHDDFGDDGPVNSGPVNSGPITNPIEPKPRQAKRKD